MNAALLALLIATSPVRPDAMYKQSVKITLNCMPTFEEITMLLSDVHNEAPVMLASMNENTTIVFFTNRERTTSTLVVTKTHEGREESCILWSGSSPEGASFSLNPSPSFKTNSTWNET